MKFLKSLLIIFLLLFAHLYSQNKNEAIIIRDDLQIQKISDNCYVHISDLYSGNKFVAHCNGLICVSGNECIIIDTPVNDEQSESLIDYIVNQLKLDIKGVIACHWHADCMGGLNVFHKHNIPSYSYKETKEIAKAKGLPLPQNVFDDSLKVDFGTDNVTAKYFGGGHTIDNIVVWFAPDKILFGGCMVKAMKWKNLGFIGDAVIDQWEGTVQKVKSAFPDSKIVVPGHDESGGMELLDHTIELVKDYKKNN